jgi:hypothetical protein
MEAVKVNPQESISIRNWKAQDWIDHASFGVGQVSESRGDKLDIDFVNGGRKTLLKSTELNQAVAPGTGFKFPRDKSKPRSGQLKVKGPPKRSLNERQHVLAPDKQVDLLPAAMKRIAESRLASHRSTTSSTKSRVPKRKRTISAAGRKRIAATQRAKRSGQR